MLHGITIQLLQKTQTGVDGFDRPVYRETAVSVENVLVGQPSSEDAATALELTGKHVQYFLGIPKGDPHDWEDATVALPAPFSGKYRTVGFSVVGVEDLVPGPWNRRVMVERYE